MYVCMYTFIHTNALKRIEGMQTLYAFFMCICMCIPMVAAYRDVFLDSESCVCMYVRTYVCMYVYVCICIPMVAAFVLEVCVLCMYVCMHLCVHVCR